MTSATLPPFEVRSPARRLAELAAAPAVGLGALGLGAAIAVQPKLALLAAVAIGAVAFIAARPQVGIYALVVLTPLTAGIDRGSVLPLIRPNEAVLGLVAVAIGVRWLGQVRSAADIHIRIDGATACLITLAATGSVLPLLRMKLSGETVTSDDFLYALVLWKFFLVYVLVRSVRLDSNQIARILQLSVAVAAVISVVSLLQTAGWGPVVDVLKKYFTTNDNAGAITSARGSSTLGLPIAVADLLTINLAIVLGAIWLRGKATPVLIGAAWLLTLGVIGAGEFSGVIGLVIGVVTLCVLVRSARPARVLLVGSALAVPVVWPVIQTRLAGFQSVTGLPVSWTGRLENLRTYFWPVLTAHHNYVLGVRPSARVPAAHRANGFVWIESGYTWLLWAGGIPMLLAFVWFVVTMARAGRASFRTGDDPLRIAALATIVAITVIAFLMIFDPHLTYRGVADELFLLLALCTTPRNRPAPGADRDR